MATFWGDRRRGRSVRRITSWFLSAPADLVSPWRAVTWWEARRLPFNLIVRVNGVLCLLVFFLAITSSGHLLPGEDAVGPVTLIAAPVLGNLPYPLGWLVEVQARRHVPDLSPRFGPLLWTLGLGIGLFLITVPAAFWFGIRLLQAARVLT